MRDSPKPMTGSPETARARGLATVLKRLPQAKTKTGRAVLEMLGRADEESIYYPDLLALEDKCLQMSATRHGWHGWRALKWAVASKGWAVLGEEAKATTAAEYAMDHARREQDAGPLGEADR